MATVLRQGGFSIKIHSHDHLPAHVHVFKAEGEVVVILDADVSVREIRGMATRNVEKAREIVDDNMKLLRKEWRRIHG